MEPTRIKPIPKPKAWFAINWLLWDARQNGIPAQLRFEASRYSSRHHPNSNVHKAVSRRGHEHCSKHFHRGRYQPYDFTEDMLVVWDFLMEHRRT